MSGESLRSVEVDGHSIAYREAGQGPPLVLLHGFLSDSRVWRPQLEGLSDNFRVVAWDAPGAGRSSDPPETFTTDDYVRCLEGFLDAVEIERVHMLGLSWGGILLQEFYRRHAQRCRSLMLADTYAGWRGSLPEEVWKARLEACLEDSYGAPDALVSKFLPGIFSGSASEALKAEAAKIVSQFHPVGFRVMSRSSAEVDTSDLLPAISVPTLLVWGDDDRRSPLEVARQFSEAIPAAQLAVIANAGHVSNTEQPAAFNACVRRFCLSV